jgi:ferredoxin-type protein NapH
MVKFILLGLLIAIPLTIANFGLHPDWGLPFCQICPAKPLLPLFAGDFSHFSIDFTNFVTMVFTLLSMMVAGGLLAGMFFKERFFCMFCPMLALMHLFKAMSPVKFKKSVETCYSCGNCARLCPMDIRQVHLEKDKKDVLTQDCLACMRCVESCPGDNVLKFEWFNFNLFYSSKSYLAKKWSGNK